ncbi:MAG: hypothetical protein EZS26_000885 [Candidatus Ordinivivax streblomastigis]|uniref:F5/8 type C domain-containing protein n=1 Tax=Candidatus Ordinivivax streblomastigis TaxID=2540710 RepID=A0A5M8P424_9BACT|nr:MAG: hypothetical protein EZS26_000885 [Candidatus Ordinivivax streblomastigis]
MFKPVVLLILSVVLLISPLQAQDLAGYQKLRGAVISTPSDDEYLRHAYNAFDTNEATNFVARETTGWVGLDLGGNYTIRKIRIFPMRDWNQQLTGSEFQAADTPDFTNPVTLFTITQDPDAGAYTTYDIQITNQYRYVRCMTPAHRCSLAELEFYTDTGAQTLAYPQLTNLPTIYLETKGNFDFVDKSIYAPSTVVVANNASPQSYIANVRGRGNSSWDFMEKKSFRIQFDKKQHFLGLPANAKNWTLIACAVDKTLLRNGLAFEMSKFLGFEFTPSCVFVDVVLDGFYYGTYFASDRIDVNENRINIDEMTPNDMQEPNISGGYQLEIDAYANLEDKYFYTNRGIPFSIKSPDSDEILPSQENYIHDHVNYIENNLFANTAFACDALIDIQSAVKYYLHSELTGNCDSYWCIHNHKKRNDDKLYFGPVWDYDQAFLTNERVPRFAATLDQQHGVAQSWFRTIMATPRAQQILDSLWKSAKSNHLKQRLLDYIDDNAALLQQSQALNFQRWNSLGRRVWFEDALFNTYDEYIQFVKQFVEDRFTWFDGFHQEVHEVILPVSARGNTPREWRYTTQTPNDDDWYLTAYNDDTWQTGNAPFGTEQNLQNTLWNSDQIYIRTQFTLTEQDLERIDKAYFDVFHDEDCWIYLNDQLALHRSDYITSYQSFEFDKSLLKTGVNTLAVQCTQTVGGQLIDIGISCVRTEPVDTRKKNYSQFDWALTWHSGTAISGSTRILFGLLLPEGWRVVDKGGDFAVAFSNSTTAAGQFAFCQFYTDYLAENLETPAGYYWWGGRAIDKITFNRRVQFDIDFSLKIATGDQTGNFDLKFATGDDPSNTIRQHFVSEPVPVEIADVNEFPAEKAYNWEQITGNFDTEYYRDKDFDGFFQRYYGWNGGDIGISTVLPDGRSVWTWGDYDAGVVNSERNRLRELNQFPRNALMVQEPYCDFSAFRLLTNGKKLGQIEPAIVYKDNAGNVRPDGEEWYWPMDGHVYYRNGVPELQVLLEHTVSAGGGQWGMEGVGVDVAVFSLPGLQLINVAKDRYTGTIGFGNIILHDDDGVAYLYGERNYGICQSPTFAARCTDGDLTGTWEFYDGKNKIWSTGHTWENGADWMDYRISPNPVFVFKDGGKYFAFEQEPCFSPNSFVHNAASPIGPFTQRRKVGALPSEITSNNFICYIPSLHQQFSKDGELLYSVSKNYNGDFDRYGNNQSANYYLPYFFRVKKWRDKLNIVANDITAGEGYFSAQFADNLQNIGDKNENTVYSATTDNGKAWIQYNAGQTLFLRQYTLTSSNDNAARDPLHWQLLGSADSISWTVLDERYHAGFEERGQTNSYTVSIDRACKYFRLNVLSVNGSQKLQIAEWQLFGQLAGSDDPGTAVKKIKPEGIRIYPNPAKNELRIVNYELRIRDKIFIYDLAGRIMSHIAIHNMQSGTIDVSALPRGMYLLKIETESGNRVLKFIKK